MEDHFIPPSSPAKLYVGAEGICGTALPPTKDIFHIANPEVARAKNKYRKGLGDGGRCGRYSAHRRGRTDLVAGFN